MTENIVEIEDLELKFYTYEGIVEALDDVGLKIKKGEILGLVGETGCGKSVTSLSILNIVTPPGKIESGHIIFYSGDEHIDLLRQKDSFLRQIRGKDISMIFQEPRAYLNPVYNVTNQISEVLTLHRKKEMIMKAIEEIEKIKKKNFFINYEKKMLQKMFKNPDATFLKILGKIPLLNKYKSRVKKALKREVIEILREMELPDPERVADAYPHELSGGMAQRVVIAMALACNPRLLIADEPTTNLDVTVQLQILNLIRKLQRRFGSSILYITHDMGVVAELCKRVAVMYAGIVCETADVIEVFKDPLHPYAKALLESIPRPGKEFKTIEGTVPSLINPPLGCRFHERCPFAMDICLKEKPKYIEVAEEHFVSCHLYSEGKK